MGLLRSERMKCGTLIIPGDAAHDYVNVLGGNGGLQFLDMHAKEMVPIRPYRKYLQRLDEMERMLRFLFDEVNNLPGTDIWKNEFDGFLDTCDSAYKFAQVETELQALYKDFSKFKINNSLLVIDRNSAIEDKYVAEFAAQKVFTNDYRKSKINPNREALLEDSEKQTGTVFSHVAGVLPAEDQDRFARFLFRATRGNSFTSFQEIPELILDPSTGKNMRKSVFVVYFQDSLSRGDLTQSAMHQRITRACQQFGVNTYPWMTSGESARRRLIELTTSAAEKQRALQAYESFMSQESARLCAKQEGGNSLLEEWRLFCLKEKSIYYILNQFQGTSTLRCDVWYTEESENDILQLLQQSDRVAPEFRGSAMLVTERDLVRKNAPTYFKTNEFVQPFQDLVFTYGVPRYLEASPVPLTMVTFPFLFGIMYGDVGHGTLVFLAGLWCCKNAEKLKFESPSAYTARYMVVMMGFFAAYAGFLYNDMFSLGIDVFGARWNCPESTVSEVECTPLYDINNGYCDPANKGYQPLNATCPPDVLAVYQSGGYSSSVYPFGIDPSWAGASNELLYLNSLKMKLAVIVGVAQMVVGLILRFSNAIYERSLTDFFFECIPMMMFMVAFFAWMDFMIFFKWVTPLGNPPSIINSMISMTMGPDDIAPLWDGMVAFTHILLYRFILTSVPLLLFPKPIILYFQNRQKVSSEGHLPLVDETIDTDEEPFEISEVAIHQVIETIEYVLGTVSHTASYLRLWALSLAHQQLSLVFWQKTLQPALAGTYPLNALFIFIQFSVWFAITAGVLLGMDVLECFLHTLRLHWVEFQSKFYRADGYLFLPYSHHSIIQPTE